MPRKSTKSGQEIIIPYGYVPRGYQMSVFRAMDSGLKRAVLVWHRRAGKDKTCLNLMIKKMFERVGAYYYYFPTYEWGKKVIWDGIDKAGVPFLNHFPQSLIADKNEQDLKITLVNGSLFRIIGTDKIHNVRGPNPVGCVFSEYPHHNPLVWDIVRPVLNENDGWAIFNFTPLGKNHAWDMYRMAQGNPNWFCELLTIKDTKDEEEKSIITEAQIEEERRAGMAEELIQQEYYCSFEGGMQGSYYGQILGKLEAKGQIGKTPWEPGLPVHTFWDLGVGDSMAIWFIQRPRGLSEIRVIDFLLSSGEGLSWYIKQLRERPYVYGEHYAPFDIKVRELSTGKSRWEIAASLGIIFRVVPKLPLEDGIDAVRRLLPQCWFDMENCRRGLDALWQYHKQYDEKRREYKNSPVHDWSSDAADAFRMMAVALREPRAMGEQRQTTADTEFNVFSFPKDRPSGLADTHFNIFR